jgi:hypothetical protein
MMGLPGGGGGGGGSAATTIRVLVATTGVTYKITLHPAELTYVVVVVVGACVGLVHTLVRACRLLYSGFAWMEHVVRGFFP